MSEDISSKSVLTDALISLINFFKENGFSPPISVIVKQMTFDKLLAESAELYNIDSKRAIREREFSLAGITMIKEEKEEQGSVTTITKYKCPDCDAIFDSIFTHRKHHQAFHDSIKEPQEIKQPVI
jgi:hypothetical protein